MRALILNCALKARPEQSNTDALLDVVAAAMRGDGIDVDVVRVVDHDVTPGVTDDEGDGDEWPTILETLRRAEILVIATPTWLGQPVEHRPAGAGAHGRARSPRPTTAAARSRTTGSAASWSPATRTARTT